MNAYSLITIILALSPIVAHATTRYVDRASTGSPNGAAWSTAYNDLQTALSVSSSGDRIYVAAGTYYPDIGSGQTADSRSSTFTLKQFVDVYGGYPSGGGSRNAAVNLTILSGDLLQDDQETGRSDNAYHVVTATNVTTGTLLDGFVIRDGNADTGSSPNHRGAGLHLYSDGSPTLLNCVFSNNTSSYGGAVYMWSCAPEFSQCTFQGNYASSDGGGVFNSSSTPTYLNCTFAGNKADRYGGGIRNYSSTVQLTNCIVWDNLALGSSSAGSKSISSYDTTHTYTNCLAESYSSLNGTNNLNGSLSTSNPLFRIPIHPENAPTPKGYLHLQSNSPARNAGYSSANQESYDLNKIDRKAGTIDLGPYEIWSITYVDQGATGSGSGSSWNNANTDLQDAITRAEEGDEIWVKKGTYKTTSGTDREATFQLRPTVALYGDFDGNEVLLSDRVTTPYTNSTFLSGEINNTSITTDNAYHVVTGTQYDSRALINGFTITGGYAKDNGHYNGGGLECEDFSCPTVVSCAFIGNHAKSDGGGASVEDDCDADFINCLFAGNTSEFAGGGLGVSNSNPTVTNCTFSGNTADYGGAVTNFYTSSTHYINCTFSGNSASFDGGAAYNNTAQSTPFYSNCLIWNNTDTRGSGGTFHSMYGDSVATLSHCLLEGHNLSSTGVNNLDGTSAANDPQFFTEIAPATAPNILGNLRLPSGSPAIGVGDSSANYESYDLDGLARVQSSTIDLGSYEGAKSPEIAVNNSSGTNLVDNATAIDLGIILLGASQDLEFTVKSDSLAPLQSIGISTSGSNSSEISISTSPASSLVALAEDALSASISFNTTGTFNATLLIASDDANEAPFEINYTAVVASDSVDTDSDGLNDYAELTVYNTDPALKDSDNDDLSDGAELALASFGFLNNVDDSVLVNLIKTNSPGLELYDASSVSAAGNGQPIVSKNNTTGNFHVKFKIEHSSDLSTGGWSSMSTVSPSFDSGDIDLDFTPPSGTSGFFRLNADSN